ncbi:NADP-dependent oxidoreductase [Streptomyces sp. NBC_01016]|uniref:NADP-dependent oxidoreductase n=1 Tax=Streptomyces sp. NBC_01016 TaxID=2903720 RepID=UPI002256FBB5|nr:NADP-dependent oxidoreductase [Streptomyces sp. NBC_01016]MCX4830140.1 NADP-dependent oxidoreductase [Streptomyces sp. NBC_01016]
MSDENTTTMKAISQDTLGAPEVLQEVEVPRPKPGIGQIVVAVHAAGLNPTDYKHRSSGLFLGEPPFVLGWDVSGVVEAVGLGVALFKPGDEVLGMLPYPYGAGSHAEYVAGPARAFVPKPAGLSHVEAGALPLVGLTAWQALVDIVLDTLGGEDRLRSLDVLKPGGILVSLLPGQFGDVAARAAELGVRATDMLVEHDQAGMRAVTELVESGKLKVHVADTYPLAEAAKAHAEGDTGRVTGKLVLTVRP